MDWSAVAGAVGAGSLYTLGRGPSWAISNEAALKFKEVCQLHAESYSSAEVLHGPVSIVDRGFPVLAFAAADAAEGALAEVADALAGKGASVFATTDRVREAERLPFVRTGHPLTDPAGADRELLRDDRGRGRGAGARPGHAAAPAQGHRDDLRAAFPARQTGRRTQFFLWEICRFPERKTLFSGPSAFQPPGRADLDLLPSDPAAHRREGECEAEEVLARGVQGFAPFLDGAQKLPHRAAEPVVEPFAFQCGPRDPIAVVSVTVCAPRSGPSA
jgi:hypothetical protein